MTKIAQSLVVSVAAVLMLSGCGALKSFVELLRADEHSMRFAPVVPEPVSVAWRDARGDVWLVPRRGVLIDQITSAAGPADWSPSGAYIVIRGNHRAIRVLADGRWWDLQVPENAQTTPHRREASR